MGHSVAPPRDGVLTRRITVREDSPIAVRTYDYADAFEVRTPEPVLGSPEGVARAALEGAPPAVRFGIWFAWHVLLRFRLGPRSGSPDHVFGARTVRSDQELIELELAGPLMRGVIVGRILDPTRNAATTFVFFERPLLARVVWTLVGPLHRTLAPYLLKHGATRLEVTR